MADQPFALADAAVRLFTEHGFGNVGVRDVAEAADVSLSTHFKHFPSKEALVFDLDADVESALIAALAGATGLTPEDPAVTGLARFALEAPSIARASEGPARTMCDLFTLLERGWATTPLARQDDRPGRDG
ncbi:helix-turn-helix domain-containing protein [Streptomyces syringium]|uniref:helix-turn-helix domain-containing protein n=1 Tax=Streptomyces syringium TaxID=76729 RepID=UPI0036526BDA